MQKKQFLKQDDKSRNYEVLALDEEKYRNWCELSKFVKEKIANDPVLQRVFAFRYEGKRHASYRDAYSTIRVYESDYYKKLGLINEIAMVYICYHRLIKIEL